MQKYGMRKRNGRVFTLERDDKTGLWILEHHDGTLEGAFAVKFTNFYELVKWLGKSSQYDSSIDIDTM